MTSSHSRAPSQALFIAVLIVVSAVNPLGINMPVPSLPSMMKAFGTDFGTVQLVLSVYLFATAIAQLFIGTLSDRFGRRPVLLGGGVLFVAASVICTIAPSIEIMLAGRAIQGVGGCAGIVLGRAIIRDGYERDKAASMMGYVAMGFAIAPLVGPAIGGLVDDHFGWRASFGLLLVVGVLATSAAWLYLPETNRSAAPGSVRAGLVASFFQLAKVPAFWAYALSSALATGVFFAFMGGTPFVASHLLGLSGTEYGAYFGLAALGYLIGNFFTARFSQRIGIATVIIIGGFVALVAAVLMAIAFGLGAITILTLFGPIGLVGLANGLILPNAIAGAVSVRPDLAGAAAGLSGSLQIGLGAVATMVIGWAVSATESALLLSLLMVVFAAAGLAACLWTRTARQ